MARIVHVGNFGFRGKDGPVHGVAAKLSNGLIRNGHYVVNFSDRDVARASTIFGHRKFGRAGVNKALRALCHLVEPELLLLGHADMIDAATLGEIRAASPSLRILQWTVDAIYFPDEVKRLEKKIGQVDATLISCAGDALAPIAKPGRVVGFLPNPVDFSVERGENYLKDTLPFDLFLAVGGTMVPRCICGTDRDLEEFMATLLRAVPRARPLLAGMSGQPHLFGAAYQSALESAAIGLNISRRNDIFLYSSDRLAHMIGNGQAVAIERATGYDTLFTEEEMVFYSSVDELFAKLNRLLEEPEYRKRIARKGRARYHELFNERIVASYLVDVAFERLDPNRYPWPTLAA
jgi:Glycosyl transferases group 1